MAPPIPSGVANLSAADLETEVRRTATPAARPALAATVVRTVAALILAAAAFSALFAQLAYPVAPWPHHAWVTVIAAGVVGGFALLYAMIRIGGMGTCTACGVIIPALWGGSYCAIHEDRLSGLAKRMHITHAWIRLYLRHGVDRVNDMIDEMGRATVLAHEMGIPVVGMGYDDESEAAARQAMTGSAGYFYTRDGHPVPGFRPAPHSGPADSDQQPPTPPTLGGAYRGSAFPGGAR
jgi:hypothetical protein